jgi:hypothetical protein
MALIATLVWYFSLAVPCVLCDKNLKVAASTEPPFHFLVQAEKMYISSKLVTETVVYQVGLNFSLSAWTQVMVDLNDRFRKFENFKFFSDAELKGEFISYSSPRFYGLTKAKIWEII